MNKLPDSLYATKTFFNIKSIWSEPILAKRYTYTAYSSEWHTLLAQVGVRQYWCKADRFLQRSFCRHKTVNSLKEFTKLKVFFYKKIYNFGMPHQYFHSYFKDITCFNLLWLLSIVGFLSSKTTSSLWCNKFGMQQWNLLK